MTKIIKTARTLKWLPRFSLRRSRLPNKLILGPLLGLSSWHPVRAGDESYHASLDGSNELLSLLKKGLKMFAAYAFVTFIP